MEDIRDVFVRNMLKYRKEKKISQDELSKRTGLHQTYISLVERKKRSPRLEMVEKIAEGLDIEEYKLFIRKDSDDK